VLSALAHGAGPERDAVLDALGAALNLIDQDHAFLYADVVLGALRAGPDHQEVLMHAIARRYGNQSDFARHYFSQGEARGEARAVLAILTARGIDVADQARERIAACTDIERLDTWIQRAVTATTVDDLFT
jgi:hypothetical protein